MRLIETVWVTYQDAIIAELISERGYKVYFILFLDKKFEIS